MGAGHHCQILGYGRPRKIQQHYKQLHEKGTWSHGSCKCWTFFLIEFTAVLEASQAFHQIKWKQMRKFDCKQKWSKEDVGEIGHSIRQTENRRVEIALPQCKCVFLERQNKFQRRNLAGVYSSNQKHTQHYPQNVRIVFGEHCLPQIIKTMHKLQMLALNHMN